jgi:hypothetical protein
MDCQLKVTHAGDIESAEILVNVVKKFASPRTVECEIEDNTITVECMIGAYLILVCKCMKKRLRGTVFEDNTQFEYRHGLNPDGDDMRPVPFHMTDEELSETFPVFVGYDD